MLPSYKYERVEVTGGAQLHRRKEHTADRRGRLQPLTVWWTAGEKAWVGLLSFHDTPMSAVLLLPSSLLGERGKIHYERLGRQELWARSWAVWASTVGARPHWQCQRRGGHALVQL